MQKALKIILFHCFITVKLIKVAKDIFYFYIYKLSIAVINDFFFSFSRKFKWRSYQISFMGSGCSSKGYYIVGCEPFSGENRGQLQAITLAFDVQ